MKYTATFEIADGMETSEIQRLLRGAVSIACFDTGISAFSVLEPIAENLEVSPVVDTHLKK